MKNLSEKKKQGIRKKKKEILKFPTMPVMKPELKKLYLSGNIIMVDVKIDGCCKFQQD